MTLAAPLGSPSLFPALVSTLSVPRLFVLGTSMVVCNFAHASVLIVSTLAPYTALAWMKTISPVGALPKPKPLSRNHLSTTSYFILLVLHLVQSSDGNLCLHFSAPFSADQNPKQLSDVQKFTLHIAHFRHHFVGDRHPHLAQPLGPLLLRRFLDQLGSWLVHVHLFGLLLGVGGRGLSACPLPSACRRSLRKTGSSSLCPRPTASAVAFSVYSRTHVFSRCRRFALLPGMRMPPFLGL